jgi:hypothetical protein
MKLIKSKKGVALLAALAVVAVAAVGAYAYFSSTGNGTGTATVGGTNAVTVNATITGQLFPLAAAPAHNVSITVSNPSGGGNEFINTVYPDTSFGNSNGITVDTTHATAGCLSSWFEFDGDGGTNGGSVSVGQNVAPGASSTPVNATLWLVNSTTIDQSKCEGATITLHLLSN